MRNTGAAATAYIRRMQAALTREFDSYHISYGYHRLATRCMNLGPSSIGNMALFNCSRGDKSQHFDSRKYNKKLLTFLQKFTAINKKHAIDCLKISPYK